jgi:hypothetical protein
MLIARAIGPAISAIDDMPFNAGHKRPFLGD